MNKKSTIILSNEDVIFCPSCQSIDVIDVGKIPSNDTFAGEKIDVVLDGGRLFTCLNCSCSFRFPRMTKDEMDALYRVGDKKNWMPKEKESRIDWEIAYSWVRGNIENKRVLDVGCFGGDFLNGLGGRASLFGIEIHQAAAERARQSGVDILGSNFDDLRDSDEEFDLVTAFDVIEHVYHPAEFLRMLVRATRPGGDIIISTGNTMSSSWKLMRSRYWYCTLLEHISFINPEWCQWVAKQYGLEISSIESFSHDSRSHQSFLNKIKEVLSNVGYHFFPFVFHFLRRRGFGAKDVVMCPELKDFPPTWMTAKDHIIVRFKKQG